jgi:hypothetical protein
LNVCSVTLESDSDEKEKPSIVVLGGSDSKTAGDTVKVSAEVGAWQVKRLPTKLLVLPPMDPIERPVMVTVVLGSPPVQFTVTPDDRVTVEMLDMLVHITGAAIWSATLKAPMSGPPLPLSNVKEPPEAGMNDVSVLGVA